MIPFTISENLLKIFPEYLLKITRIVIRTTKAIMNKIMVLNESSCAFLDFIT